jgi:hypothetical protein
MKLDRVKFIPILLTILGLGILIALIPTWTKIQELKSSINEDRITLNELERTKERSSNLLLQTREIENQLNQLNDRLLTAESALTYITTLESTAAAAGITVNVDTFDPPTGKETTGVLRFSAQGDLTEVLAFLQSTERFPWLTSVEVLSLGLPSAAERAPDSQNPNTILMTVSAKTHWSSLSST